MSNTIVCRRPDKSNDLRRASPRRFSLRPAANATGHETRLRRDTKQHERHRDRRLKRARHFAFRAFSCPANAGFVSGDAPKPEGGGMSGASDEAKPQVGTRRSCRISSQDDTAHRRLSWSRVRAINSTLSASAAPRGNHGGPRWFCLKLRWIGLKRLRESHTARSFSFN